MGSPPLWPSEASPEPPATFLLQGFPQGFFARVPCKGCEGLHLAAKTSSRRPCTWIGSIFLKQTPARARFRRRSTSPRRVENQKLPLIGGLGVDTLSPKRPDLGWSGAANKILERAAWGKTPQPTCVEGGRSQRALAHALNPKPYTLKLW